MSAQHIVQYASKVDGWLVVMLVLPLVGAVLAWRSLSPGSVSPLIVLPALLLAVGMPVWVFVGTYYRLSATCLDVHSGPFRWQVPLEDITNVVAPASSQTGPALSMDRLRVDYCRGKTLIISPRSSPSFRVPAGLSFSVVIVALQVDRSVSATAHGKQR